MKWIVFGPEPIFPNGRDTSHRLDGGWLTIIEADVCSHQTGGAVEFAMGTMVCDYRPVLVVNNRCWTSIEPLEEMEKLAADPENSVPLRRWAEVVLAEAKRGR